MSLMRSLTVRLALVLALFGALASSGLAHRFVPVDADLATYLASGGSYADICRDVDGGHAAGQTCDACRLVDAAAVPPAGLQCSGRIAIAAPLAPFVVADAPAKGGFDPNRPVRAPPLV